MEEEERRRRLMDEDERRRRLLEEEERRRRLMEEELERRRRQVRFSITHGRIWWFTGSCPTK